MLQLHRFSALTVLASVLVLGACGDDDPSGPVIPVAPLGVTATATGSSTIRVSFNSSAGISSYTIERAEGAAGAFAQAGTVTAPATPGAVTYNDVGLKVQTLYRYRAIAVQGSQSSTPSGETSATTLAFGAFGRDITGDITTNTTLYADTAYTLKGFIHVANAATLTIQPGTVIKGDEQSALFVLRGAKINAVGRADAPIVMTSSKAVGSRRAGDWGGLIIIGNATINKTTANPEVEGTGTDGTTVASGKNYTLTYGGGTTDTDDSGILQYVRVEFAGFAPRANQELNSFTFSAVGSGTRLSFLQAMYGLDDAFEWFGGTVSATNLVSYETGDDHFDMSEGFRGRLQFIIGLQSATLNINPLPGQNVATDPQGFENDGCDGAGCNNGFDSAPLTTPVVANFTLIGTGNINVGSGSSGGVGMVLRRGTGGYYVNGLLAKWPRAAISIRDQATYNRAGGVATPVLTTADLALRNIVIQESPTSFEAGTARFTFDLAGNALTAGTGTTNALFAAYPATITDATTVAAFDWTPAAASAIATGGLNAFTGKLATAAGTAVTATAFVGAAAPGGTKWWQGWTNYAQK
ncbi:MAG: fibronectin type III domain-containing protein [Cytophagaceae bacterium]|nr:fibronectin type III domain-containing protein [Gemmatimonadaceae bacterium]